jgi:FkbM family methyltransferase
MNIKSSEFIGRKVRPVEFALFIKWLLRIKRYQYLLPDGNKFYIDPISDFGLKLMKHNSYEVSMTNQIKKLLGKNDVFIDLGANEGFFSIVAGQLIGRDGVVIAIEPQQRLWEIIVKNVEVNKLSNVMLLPYGIGCSQGEAEMHFYPSLNSGASSLAKSFNFKVSLRRFRKAIYSTSKISIQTLDHIIPKSINNIKLIKIDIEGFEFEALKGAQNLLSRGQIENLLIEIHPEALNSMGESEKSIDDLLFGYGFKKENIDKDLVLYSRQAVRPS